MKNIDLDTEKKLTSLGELVTFRKGVKPDLTKSNGVNCLPYLSADYFRTGTAQSYVNIEESKRIVVLNKEDVALIWDGSNAGEVFTGLEGVLSSTMVKVEPTNGIMKPLLYYFLKTQFGILNSKTTGTTIPHVSRDALIKLQLYVPSSLDQQKIVSILSEIEKAIFIEDKLLATFKELKTTLMSTLFTQEDIDLKTCQLSEIARIERGKFAHRPRNDPEFYGGNIPFIQTGDVTSSNGYIEHYSQTLNEKGLAVSRVFPKGTIVITIAANIGYTGILGFDCAFPDSLIGISPNIELIDVEYLNYYLQTQQPIMDSLAPRGTQKNINIQFLLPWPVPTTTLEKQKKKVSMLKDIDKKIRLCQKKRIVYNELFNSISNSLLIKGEGLQTYNI